VRPSPATLGSFLIVFRALLPIANPPGPDALRRLFAFILICIGIRILGAGFAELWSTLPPR
jgi:hypothetical protein